MNTYHTDHYQSTSLTKNYLAYLYNTVPRDHDLLTGTDNVVTVTYTIYTSDKNRKTMNPKLSASSAARKSKNTFAYIPRDTAGKTCDHIL